MSTRLPLCGFAMYLDLRVGSSFSLPPCLDGPKNPLLTRLLKTCIECIGKWTFPPAQAYGVRFRGRWEGDGGGVGIVDRMSSVEGSIMHENLLVTIATIRETGCQAT